MFSMDEEESHLTTATNRLVSSSMNEIEKLYKQYENDLYMTGKINHYIKEQLPGIIKTIELNRQKSNQRNLEHQGEQEKFIMEFLSQHRYYYNITNEQFFHYNGTDFKMINEDNILHNIVSTISDQNNHLLMNRKHQTKVMLLKRYKDQSILKAIPDSETIQKVIHLMCPLLCATKQQTKYLLTVLGDNILKKNLDMIHYVSTTIKPFLSCINQISIEKFHIQCTHTLRYKYHDKHDDCKMRLIKYQHQPLDEIWDEQQQQFIQNGLNILCVACHYSRKYGSSDEYVMEYSNDLELQDYVFRLKNRNATSLVTEFAQSFLYNRRNMDSQQLVAISASPVEEHFLQQQLSSVDNNNNNGNQFASSTNNIPWTHVQYLWKTYLETHEYPYGLYCSTNKSILCDTIFPGQYDKINDCFQDVGSSQWPLIQKFLKFWDETIILEDSPEMELEADEIALLFRKWLHIRQNQKRPKYLLKESQIIDILTYFHPSIEIVDNKFVLRVQNTLWDKDMDITTAITQWRIQEPDAVFSLHDAYHFYTRYHYAYGNHGEYRPLMVGKKYFEHYCNNHGLNIWQDVIPECHEES